ncbi:MAG TPA: molybdenum cofactor biosynthesis protein MoaE [Pirellulaceae bacterium]|nr:molybdenum cofactor biosynthesis protein MoaE [Pirellulaceae bacterium]HMO93661.1 molybdenum cofactor biosynthesis protein MoaE [Pirellulaceae bacterium]HMP70665.1 molybdenum cofactor biosynthesis protein MoaE [Pirellulaceae bacterium]
MKPTSLPDNRQAVDFFAIVQNKIDTQQLLERTGSENAGANVLFVGTTRRLTGNLVTTYLEYECYEAMAIKEMRMLAEIAHSRWSDLRIAMVHRTGVVGVGEASVAVSVSSAHRKEAFAAAAWLIETLKQRVPIWKKEYWLDGSSEWIHPEMTEQEQPPRGQET